MEIDVSFERGDTIILSDIMKGIASFVAGSVAFAASAAAVAAPARIEARASASATSSGSLPTITTNGNGEFSIFAGYDEPADKS